jgi:NDP-sugar pyrophosphorylase family protein
MLPIAILAGGLATRLGLLAAEVPKCLIKINGRPFVDWQLELLIKNGYSDFVFCTSHKSEMVQDYLGDGSNRGVRIQYSLDGITQLGTGGAIQKALPLLGDMFGVIYGDSYLPTNYSEAEEYFLGSKAKALMTVYENKNEFDLSNTEFVDGKIINYEKGSNNERMQHIDYGLTFFNASAFYPWKDSRSFDLSDVFRSLTNQGQLFGFEVYERFYEIGSVRGIEEFSQYLRKAHNDL